MAKIIIFNKPYGVLSQFSDADGHPGLGHHLNQPGFYPAGRLDRDSEGLLLLTNNGKLQAHISHPQFKKEKSYWVQVEGLVQPQQLRQLAQGINLKEGLTLPASAKEIDEPAIWPRVPPIRERKSLPTSWLELTITEGKNRQVRRMTAAVGLPTLRLIRHRIGTWQLADLQPCQYQLEDVNLPPQNSRPTTQRKTRTSNGKPYRKHHRKP